LGGIQIEEGREAGEHDRKPTGSGHCTIMAAKGDAMILNRPITSGVSLAPSPDLSTSMRQAFRSPTSGFSSTPWR
jgi:hypothetical protein